MNRDIIDQAVLAHFVGIGQAEDFARLGVILGGWAGDVVQTTAKKRRKK